MLRVKEHSITVKDLQKAGYPVTTGRDYMKGFHWPLPKNRKVSLKEVQQFFKKIRRSLAEEVSKMRNEEG